MGRSFVGRDAVREGFQMAWQTFPDAAWSDGVHFAQGDLGLLSECSRESGRWPRVECMVDVFTFRDGKIAVKNAFRKDRPPIVAGCKSDRASLLDNTSKVVQVW